MRAGGTGVPEFFTRAGVGTLVADTTNAVRPP
jgi:acyl CoA:acetate/3-ketoacid CoA transferase alpha subunit